MNGNEQIPGVAAQVEHALAHIEAAERDVAAARSAERSADEELREAVDELEDARQARTDIILNGQAKTVEGHEVTFHEIVKLAFPGATPEQNVTFAVTYHRAAGSPHAGELAAGGRVHVKEGTRFNVTRTVQS